MRFLEIINRKKIALVSLFLFVYVVLNLLVGERGLISYYEKKILIKELVNKKKSLEGELYLVEKKNDLLTDTIDKDYLETLYRQKFKVGKKSEKIFIK